MKVRLSFYIDGVSKEEIIDLPKRFDIMFTPFDEQDKKDIMADIANNELIEFVFDSIDAGVELIDNVCTQ